MSSLRVTPIRLRWLLCGYGWVMLCGVVALTARISNNDRTLFAWNHAPFALVAAGMLVLLAIGTLELRWRIARHRAGPAFLSLVISASVMAFSLLGFVFGVLSMGVIGFCVLMSSLPVKPTNTIVHSA
jgi:hypothetical protein